MLFYIIHQSVVVCWIFSSEIELATSHAQIKSLSAAEYTNIHVEKFYLISLLTQGNIITFCLWLHVPNQHYVLSLWCDEMKVISLSNPFAWWYVSICQRRMGLACGEMRGGNLLIISTMFITSSGGDSQIDWNHFLAVKLTFSSSRLLLLLFHPTIQIFYRIQCSGKLLFFDIFTKFVKFLNIFQTGEPSVILLSLVVLIKFKCSITFLRLTCGWDGWLWQTDAKGKKVRI